CLVCDRLWQESRLLQLVQEPGRIQDCFFHVQRHLGPEPQIGLLPVLELGGRGAADDALTWLTSRRHSADRAACLRRLRARRVRSLFSFQAVIVYTTA